MITIVDRKFTDAQLAEIYERGASVKAIADATGLTVSWTYRRLKRAGIDVVRPRRECLVSAERLAEEYLAGASISMLAERHGSYYKQVRQLLLEHGVVLRPSTRSPDSPRA